MKARPILFSGPMVRALLEGRKTQTRRIVKRMWGAAHAQAWAKHGDRFEYADNDGWHEARPPVCPYGQPGDLLIVRETWQYADWTDDGQPWIRYRADGESICHEGFPEDWAERLNDIWAELSDPKNYDIDNRAADRRWRPALHMPRWASRLTLRLTDVRVEQLNEISDGDCIAEGVSFDAFKLPGDTALVCYRRIWEEINGSCSWGDNPWVWALTFEVSRENVDAVLARARAAA